MEENVNNFKPSDVFMKAYTRTLEKAVNSKYGKSDFQCDVLECKDCPFNCCSDAVSSRTCMVKQISSNGL